MGGYAWTSLPNPGRLTRDCCQGWGWALIPQGVTLVRGGGVVVNFKLWDPWPVRTMAWSIGSPCNIERTFPLRRRQHEARGGVLPPYTLSAHPLVARNRPAPPFKNSSLLEFLSQSSNIVADADYVSHDI